jgi:hypothetical protein
MADQAALFDIEPLPLPEPAPKESATVRRTKRQAAALARGRHPLSLVFGFMRLHPDAAPADDRTAPGRRCGNCTHRQPVGGHAKDYPKCVITVNGRMVRNTGSEATDIRAWWPACTEHDYGDSRQVPAAAEAVSHG